MSRGGRETPTRRGLKPEPGWLQLSRYLRRGCTVSKCGNELTKDKLKSSNRKRGKTL